MNYSSEEGGPSGFIYWGFVVLFLKFYNEDFIYKQELNLHITESRGNN